MIRIRLTYLISLILVSFNIFAYTRIELEFLSGSFTYDSDTLQGASTTFFSPGLAMYKSITEEFEIGPCTEIHLNSTNQTSNLSSIGLCNKMKIYSQKKFSFLGSDNSLFEFRPKYTTHLNFNLKRYNYYLGKNIETETEYEQNGNFVNLDIGFGGIYQLTKNYNLTCNIYYTLFSFAASDDRIKFKSLLLAFGLSKEF